MNIPENLLGAPTQFSGKAPVRSLAQELPFSDLLWENFEKLCLRLAKETTNVETCRLYGVGGDKQEGIDIYARRPSAEKYTVYQCKREEKFGPKKIEEAVETFLSGEWAAKSEEFVLCTKESLRARQRQDEVIKQRDRLSKLGITFTVWDSDELSQLLKSIPQIVYEFFGIVWCEEFCGAELTKTVKHQKPLPEKPKYSEVPGHIHRLAVPVTNDSPLETLNTAKTLFRLIEEQKKIVLLGAANNGKSTELNQLAFKLATQSNYYPFLIKLKNYSNESISDYIRDVESIPHSSLVVLLDGLDEVRSDGFEDTRRKIQRFSEDYREARIVVSCRTNFYVADAKDPNLDTLQGFTPYRLADLTRQQVDEYLNFLTKREGFDKDAFLSQIQQKRFFSLLNIPYYLIRLTKQFRDEGKIANSTGEITENLIKENIKKDVARYFAGNRTGQEERIYRLLMKVAFILECRGKNNCQWNELESFLSQDELGLMKAGSSLLEGTESFNSQWSFTHNNIQELLAAAALKSENVKKIRKIICFPNQYDRVKPSWANTISLLVSILDQEKRKTLINFLITDHKDLLIRFETELIDVNTRFSIFKQVFEHYAKIDTRINESKYSLSLLASFGKSDFAIDFLLEKISASATLTERRNGLMLLSHINTDLDFPQHLIKVKSAIENNIYAANPLPYPAIRAYSMTFRLSNGEFDKLFEYHVNSTDTWTISALYNAVLQQAQQERYLHEILNKIAEFIKTETTEREGRLADEYILLRECIMGISSVAALEQLLEFLKSNYSLVYYSTYFKELIDFALAKAAEQSGNVKIYQLIKELFISEDVYLADSRNTGFLNYFKGTNQTVAIFKDIYRSQSPLSRTTLLQLSQLAETSSLDFVVEEFKAGKLSKDEISTFQGYLVSNSHSLLEDFNKKISAIEIIPLPVLKDYQAERKKRNALTKRILFDKTSFIGLINRLFQDAGKDEISRDEMWDITRGDDSGLYPPVLYEALRLKDASDVLKREIILERIDRKWDKFSIGEIYRFLKNESEIELPESERLHLRKWCDKQLTSWNFKDALKKTENGFSTTYEAIYTSFFIRRFRFNDYSEDIYLDMLSFNKWDDDAEEIFEFVKSVVGIEKIDSRALSNLKSGNLLSGPFENHLNYIQARNLTASAPLLIPYITNSDGYKRHEVLQCYLAFGGSLDVLEESLVQTTDNFRFEIIKILIERRSQKIKVKVNELFRKSKDENEKLRYAYYLVQLQNTRGIMYFIKHIRKYKEVPIIPDAPHFSFLNSARSLNFLPWILKSYRLGARKDIKQEVFSNLQSISASALNAVCLADENFPKARLIFRLYAWVSQIEYFFNRSEDVKRVIADLNFYFENIEQQYFVNKGATLTFSDAAVIFNTLKRG